MAKFLQLIDIFILFLKITIFTITIFMITIFIIFFRKLIKMKYLFIVFGPLLSKIFTAIIIAYIQNINIMNYILK